MRRARFGGRGGACGLALALALAACGGDGGARGGGDGPSGIDGGPGPEGRLDAARAAATAAADEDPRCEALVGVGQPPGFYWEIGDADGVLASGARGAYGFDTVATVASATKIVTAIYFAERLGGVDPDTAEHLRFTSGWAVDEQRCARGLTVEGCFESFGGEAAFDPDARGQFHYGPLHMQRLAMRYADLRGLTPAGLAPAMNDVLGLETPFTFRDASLASGIEAGPRFFRELLQKVVRRGYVLSSLLGEDATCTRGCDGETSSPVDEPWTYGFGHWVEDGAVEGTADGAFTALGATGFYVWVDASRRYYGMLGRWASPLGGDPVPEPSAFCGQRIRGAFLDALGRSADRCGDADRRCAPGERCCDGACAGVCP